MENRFTEFNKRFYSEMIVIFPRTESGKEKIGDRASQSRAKKNFTGLGCNSHVFGKPHIRELKAS